MPNPEDPGVTIYSKIGAGGASQESFATQNPDFAFNLYLSTPVVNTYPMLTSSVSAFDVASITGFTSAGTATLSVEIEGVPIPGLTSVVLTTTEQTFNASAPLRVGVGDRLVVDVEAVGSPSDLELTIACTR